MRIPTNPVLQSKLKNNVDENLKLINELLGNSPDLVTRKFYYGIDDSTAIGVIYLKELSNCHLIQDNIISNLMLEIRKVKPESKNIMSLDAFTQLRDFVLTVGDLEEITDFFTLSDKLLSGDTILVVNGHTTGFSISTKKWRQRSIEEPNTEVQVKGSKIGFNENNVTNIAQIRRKIKNVNLRFETKTIGETSKTDVVIVYIADLTDENILYDVRRRLGDIKIEGVLNSGYIEHNIDNKSYSPFPTIFSTERPDLLCAKLLEGRVGILVDGSPFAIIVPTIFGDFFKTMEDYIFRKDISSIFRIIRYISFLLAVSIPALYIALTTYHQEMIPEFLLINFLQQQQGVALPIWAEVILLLFVYEIFIELSRRLPTVVGDTIILVGGLVISETAVKAGFISLAALIIVSLTAVTSYVFSSFDISNTIVVLRLIFLVSAIFFGLYGIILAFIAILLHLCSIKSFQVPYFPLQEAYKEIIQKDNLTTPAEIGVFNKIAGEGFKLFKRNK